MIDLIKKEYNYTYILFCSKCEREYDKYTEIVKFNPESLNNADRRIVTSVLSCPECDKDNWQKNCGVDFETYPGIKEALIKQDAR